MLLVAWSPNLVMFFVAWVVAGFAQSAVLYPPAFAVITRWYGSRRVGPLTTVTLVGGLASTVFAPLVAFLIDQLRLADELPRDRRHPGRHDRASACALPQRPVDRHPQRAFAGESDCGHPDGDEVAAVHHPADHDGDRDLHPLRGHHQHHPDVPGARHVLRHRRLGAGTHRCRPGRRTGRIPAVRASDQCEDANGRDLRRRCGRALGARRCCPDRAGC